MKATAVEKPATAEELAAKLRDAAQQKLAVVPVGGGRARGMGGVHLEGPFISSDDGARGAHPREYVRPPDWDLFRRWQEAAGGRIRILTMSPEWPGSADFISRCAQSGRAMRAWRSAMRIDRASAPSGSILCRGSATSASTSNTSSGFGSGNGRSMSKLMPNPAKRTLTHKCSK
jgi:N-acetylglucosamine-6-phosphate deacetylase